MKIIWLLLTLLSSSIAFANESRDYIRIIGSSTLYPFVTVAAEKFGRIHGHTPVVESTGTGGGFNLLCSGNNSLQYPDIVAASRAIKPSEIKLCSEHGIKHFKSITIGYDAIIIAQNSNSVAINLTIEQLFLAMSATIPHNGKLVNNFYNNWNQIDPNLPNHRIEIYGPASTSGTRDVVIKEIIEKFGGIKIREDGRYIEMPEDHNLVIQKLVRNDKSLGIIGFSFLNENPQIKPVSINKITPTHQNIIDGKYPFTRALMLYINYDHVKKIPGLSQFIQEISSKSSIGKNGYLTNMGLITKD